MGAVDTTYTFTATDTITSAKMNNIIDQTTITTDAIIGTTLDVASGKLKIRSAGITSNEMGSASVTQAALAPNVVGNGPAFMAYSSVATSVTNATNTKITLDAEDYDTNSNFANSRFTATVAGYYQITGSIYANPPLLTLRALIFKNGTEYRGGSHIGGANGQFQMDVNALVYLNGTTDYVELYGYQASGGTYNIGAGASTYMCGFLARSA
jgi:hypothetical protein